MADLGGLNLVSNQGAEAPVAMPDVAPVAPENAPETPIAQSATDKLHGERIRLDEHIQKLQNSLSTRNTTQTFDPAMLKMAQGFLSPTKTGSFGESAGIAAGAYADEKNRQKTQEQSDLENQFKLAQMQYGMHKENTVSDLASKLYTQSKDASGNISIHQNPEVAAKLYEVTQDPKYMEKVIADQKTKQLRTLSDKMFTSNTTKAEDGTEKTTLELNPNALNEIMKISDNPVEDIAKYSEMIPKLRKSGLLKIGTTDISSPFDALILMAPSPAIKAQAEHLAKQYSNGMIDEDKANTLAQQMLTMATAHMDRESTAKFNQQMQGLILGMRQDALAYQKTNTAMAFQLKQQELDKKLTDEQKITYRSVIVPTITEGIKASTALASVDQITETIKNAPSGALSGYYNKSLGAWFGTDANTALRDLDREAKLLITQIPRLPGSQSNFDAQNLEKSIGSLSDPKLTNSQRTKLLGKVKEGFTKLQNRAQSTEDYWETHHKLDPDLLKTPQATSEKTTKVEPLPKPANAPSDAKPAPDGHWYSPDPNRPGKYLDWSS